MTEQKRLDESEAAAGRVHMHCRNITRMSTLFMLKSILIQPCEKEMALYISKGGKRALCGGYTPRSVENEKGIIFLFKMMMQPDFKVSLHLNICDLAKF